MWLSHTNSFSTYQACRVASWMVAWDSLSSIFNLGSLLLTGLYNQGVKNHWVIYYNPHHNSHCYIIHRHNRFYHSDTLVVVFFFCQSSTLQEKNMYLHTTYRFKQPRHRLVKSRWLYSLFPTWVTVILFCCERTLN